MGTSQKESQGCPGAGSLESVLLFRGPGTPLHSPYPDLLLEHLARPGRRLGSIPAISARTRAQASLCWLSCSPEVGMGYGDLIPTPTNCWFRGPLQ